MISLLLSSTLLVSPPQQVVRTLYDSWVHRPRASPMDVLDDLDGDGVREILIGESSDPFGELRILSGASGEITERLQVNELHMGRGVAHVGDVTGDGVGDFLGSGYLGSLGHLWDGATLARLWDGTSFDSATGIGDIDGDGIGEYLVAYYGIHGFQGSATVYYGGRYQPAYTVTEPGGVGFGAQTYGEDSEALGDVDGDGIGDFAIGAPGRPFSEYCSLGEVYVYSGVDGRRLYRLEGETINSVFGGRIAALGDVTGDGLGDFAVSAVLCCDVFGCNSGGNGRVSYFDGASGKLLEHVPAPGGIIRFGENIVEGVGDLDGNGSGDVLVQGAAFHAGTGQYFGTIFALDGGTRRVIYSFWSDVQVRCGYLEMSAVGDMDGDDFPDFTLSSVCSTLVGDDRIETFSGAPIGVRTIGTPCEVAGKTLRIGATGVPRIGTRYAFHLTGLGAGVEARLVIGTEVAASTGHRLRRCPEVLPVEVLPALSKPLRPGEGVASAELLIPNRAELIGTKLYAQWLLRDGQRPVRSRILEIVIQPSSPYRAR